MLIKNFLNKKRNSTYKHYIIKPKNISVEISNNCNLRCKICNQWKEKNNIKKLGFKDLKRVINEISEFFNDTVLEFSGPEPLTNQKLLFQALEYARNKGIKTALSTNGSLINKKIAMKLIMCDLNHISISLDSDKSSVQDYMRNCKGLFKKNIAAIKNLVRAKQNTDSKTIISVTCTITNYNMKDLIKVYKLSRSLSVNSINYNAYVIDNSYLNRNGLDHKKDEFWIKEENIPYLKKNIKLIIDIIKKNGKPTIATPQKILKEIPDYFQKKELFHKGVCKAGLNYFHITNFGEVTVCGKGPHLNIKDYRIRDILQSENFKKTLAETEKCKIPCLNNCFHLE